MKRTEDTFEFPQELDKKLRELRLRASLSIEELVHRMGRSKGFRSHLSKLELGTRGGKEAPQKDNAVDLSQQCT